MLSIEAPRLRSKCVGNGLICSSFVYNAGFVVIVRSLPSDFPLRFPGSTLGTNSRLISYLLSLSAGHRKLVSVQTRF